jgi:hypothetical protein
MVYVIVVIALVVLIFGGAFLRRKSAKRGFSYVPDPETLDTPVFGSAAIPKVTIPTAEFKTEEISHDEFKSDVADDLLDPRNPKHAAWVKEHPEMESDAEWVKEHPEDNPQ